MPRASATDTSELSIAFISGPRKTAEMAFARSGQARLTKTGGSPGNIVSTGCSREKSGSCSPAARFWNAAFFRANTPTARLYAVSVASHI